MVKKISKRHILTFFIIFVIVTALASPADYIAETLGAFILYAKNVLPALFPFIFFNKMLTMIGSANELSRLLKKPLSKIYHAPPTSGYVMIMSIFCGYPIGSKLTRDLYDGGVITRDQTFIVSTLSSICGPIFVIGTVSNMLGNSTYGYIIYFSHLLSAFINGLIFRPKHKPDISEQVVAKSNCDDILSKSMIDSILSILIVGGYIAIMSFFITLLDKIGVTKVVVTLFEYAGVKAEITTTIWYGLFEMTRGISNLAKCNLAPIFSISFATFIITFGGICIALQSLNYSQNCGVTTAKYLLSKLTQAIIATAISVIFAIIIF